MDQYQKALSLPVRGAWIEMTGSAPSSHQAGRRSPCGERGLKSVAAGAIRDAAASLPVRGAWIEMSPAGGVGVLCKSLPVRGAWIEIVHIHQAE